MTILQVVHGSPVATVKGLCEQYHVSDRTVRTVIKEMQQQRERYGDYTVLGDGHLNVSMCWPSRITGNSERCCRTRTPESTCQRITPRRWPGA